MKQWNTPFGHSRAWYICVMIQKAKNTIPVIDICSLNGTDHRREDIVAEPFARYLEIHPNLYRAHRHTFYHMVLFTKGQGSHTVDFERFEVRPGQIYFMIPGQVHSWSFEGETDGYIVNFSEAIFRHFLADQDYLERFSFFAGDASDSVLQLDEEVKALVETCFRNILREVKQGSVYSLDLIRASLLRIFNLVAGTVAGALTDNQPQQSNRVVLDNFRKLVNRHFAQYKLPKDYAALLYITPNHLNAVCQDFLGKPAGEIIRDRILVEAKRLLVNADTTVSDIAYQLNFTDNSYFTKFFKKYAGMTPEEFKKGI